MLVVEFGVLCLFLCEVIGVLVSWGVLVVCYGGGIFMVDDE